MSWEYSTCYLRIEILGFARGLLLLPLSPPLGFAKMNRHRAGIDKAVGHIVVHIIDNLTGRINHGEPRGV